MSVPLLVVRLVAYSLLLAGAFGLTFYYASAGTPELNYFKEWPQDILLALIIILPALAACRHRVGRSLCACIALFFVACAFREFDNELDALLFDSAWKPPAIAMGLALLYVVVRRWRGLVADLRAVGDSVGFGVFLLGLVQLMVFSRLWGGNDMWRALMAEGRFDRNVVRVSEEGIELMAYAVIAIGVTELVLRVRAADAAAA